MPRNLWRPLKEAPQDGRPIAVRRDDWQRMAVMRWHQDPQNRPNYSYFVPVERGEASWVIRADRFIAGWLYADLPPLDAIEGADSKQAEAER